MKNCVDLKNAFDQFFAKQLNLNALHNIIKDVKKEDLINFIKKNKKLRADNDDPNIKQRYTEEIQIIKNLVPALDS